MFGVPVELEQDVVDDLLVVGVGFEQVVSDFVVDGLNGVQHAAAAVAVRVAITSFDGFVRAGAGAGWDGGAAQRAAGELDIGLDGGIAARVEDFARVDARDGGVGGHGREVSGP